MAAKRKKRGKSSTADPSGRAKGSAAPATAAISSEEMHIADKPSWVGSVRPDPPRRHVWFLVASALAVGSWMVFLVAMAMRG
jgi:hypothetical protein